MNPLKIQEMLGQAKQMQEQMQQKLSQSIVEASSGGGAVTVKMNGKKGCASSPAESRVNPDTRL